LNRKISHISKSLRRLIMNSDKYPVAWKQPLVGHLAHSRLSTFAKVTIFGAFRFADLVNVC